MELFRSRTARIRPHLSIPVGLTPEGKPAGLWTYSGFLKEPTLLALAYDLEQAIKSRTQPQFLGSVPPEPPDAGILCDVNGRSAPKLVNGRAKTSHHIGSGKPFIQ